MGIEIISELLPKNNAKFALMDVNNLRGGYIQVETLTEMEAFLEYKDRLKEGMLCYVKEISTKDHMYQYKGGIWTVWEGQGGSGGGTGSVVVDTLEELQHPDYQLTGLIAFIKELDTLYYYNGNFWESFSRIYIQDTPPEDLGGIWIDTSENKEHLKSNTVIQSLIKTIAVLEAKIQKMEYAFNCHMDFGDFTNNNFHAFNDEEGIEPDYGGSSEEDDNIEQEENTNTELADSPEPVEYKEFSANCRHLSVKSGTYDQMQENKDDFAPSELLWCYDKQQLWIKDPKTYRLIQIGTAGGGVNPDLPEDIMEGIITKDDKIAGIEFVDMVNPTKSYLVEVHNGAWNFYDKDQDTKNLPNNNTQVEAVNNDLVYYTTGYEPKPSGADTSKPNPMFFINMVYCGGNDSTEKSYNPCNYNFVELANLTTSDINLNGLYLHYTENAKSIDGSRYWITLPLKGTIKKDSTFLIRGAKCGQDNFAHIKVGTPDMYWTQEQTFNSTHLDDEEYSVWDDNGFLKFSSTCSFYLSGSDTPTDATYDKTPLVTDQPFIKTPTGVIYGYIDLVGFGVYNAVNMPSNGDSPADEATKDRLMIRYYTMDPTSQAYVALTKRASKTQWVYVDLVNTNSAIDLSKYTPVNSKLGKNIFFNKNLLTDGKPCFVNVTFGYDAHKTRGFTWVSTGYRDEFLQYKKEGESDWTTVESFKKGDGRDGKGRNWDSDIYNRIRNFTTDGTYFTVHKCLVDFEEPQERQKYIYRVGYEGHWTNERSFEIRNRQDAIDKGFNYLHVTDQQGFNQEEYETWRLAADFINSKDPEEYDFIINTGDATQNGNRINEWVDYFNTGDSLTNHLVQMYTVGNNDLCPVVPYELGNGSELTKANPINVEYFFTFEHPYEIPRASSGKYIPCIYSFIYGDTYFLSMNSEITNKAIAEVFEHAGTNIYSETIKYWCEQDLTHLDDSIQWKVTYCHEAPFTILTNEVVEDYIKWASGDRKDPGPNRGGTKMNTIGNYWFSRFLQDNGFNLCMCGHKHTYANSRYIRETEGTDSFVVDIYDPEGENAAWYKALAETEKDYRVMVNISDKLTDEEGNPRHYVKYVMAQATGYKLTSNKELPGLHLPFLKEYYKVTSAIKVNPGQQYPNYIIWSVGKGKETETEYLWNFNTHKVDEPETPTLTEDRPRIVGHSKKIWNTAKGTVSASKNWNYKYNSPVTLDNVGYYGGNGESANNGGNNIIIEKLV